METKEFIERLKNYPQLKRKMEKLLLIVENSQGEIELADDAEEMIIQIGRSLNRDVLQAWAKEQAIKKSDQFNQNHPKANKDIKKNSMAH